MNPTLDPSPLAPRPSLLPARLMQPLMLLWLWVIPQAALLLLNLRAWSLASGEATPDQAHAAAQIGAAGLGLFIVGLVAWGLALARRKPVGLPVCLIGLLLNIAYLWLFMAGFDHLWPRTVADWMLPQTEVVFYQFALVMPALFYCGLRLACLDLPLKRGADIGLSFGMFVAVPLAWYVLFHVIELLTHRFFRGSMEAVAIVFFAGSTVMVMMAFLRLLYFLYAWLSGKSWGPTAMTAASGLLFPIAGLLLNIQIPFPCDFQSAGVYVLTLLNGAALIVPLPRRDGLAALTLWVRSALYLFSLYFFLVFLPFLPLSLLAMLVCGAGFLILAPTLLFIIHTRRLASDVTTLAARIGRRPVLALAAAGLITLPVILTARAAFDRHALTTAMDVVFSPDLTQSRADISPRAVSHALGGLRDMKDGIFLPFLSDAYNRVVFNGMVLPDDKMDTLSRALLGRPAATPQKSDRFSFFLAPRAASRWGGNSSRPRPPRQVALLPPVVDERAVSNQVLRATVKLQMTNEGPANSEFVGTLAVPDGIVVSGFWLDVGGKRKPGAIIEKKTALWVYHMIRDYTRRDPGLLVCEPDGSLKLSVFPFGANETRTVWIEFMGPASWQAPIRINTESVTLNAAPASGTAPCVVTPADACVIPAATLAQFPSATRTPIVRFVLDRSAAATHAAVIPPELVAAAGALGGRCRVTCANVESVDEDLAPQSPADARDLAQLEPVLPARGGFCPDRVIARHLLEVPTGGATVPVFVVIPAPGSTPVRTLDLAPFARLTPDVPGYYLWSSNRLEWVAFADGSRRPAETLNPPVPVILFRAVNRTTAVLPDAASALIDLRGEGAAPAATSDKAPLAVYNPDSGSFETVPALGSIDHAAYATGLRLQLDSQAIQMDPSSLDASLPLLVAGSRDAGVLCPFTSFIVVENSAQEKTLLARQKQALGGHHALEFEEKSVQSPEPGVLWLAPVVLLILYWRCRRQRRTA